MHTPDPILSTDGKFWIDPTDGRTIPVVRGGDGPDDPPASPETPPSTEAPPAPGTETETPPASPSGDEPDHTFDTIEDAVAALRETRQEAAQRRLEAKELKSRVEKFDTSLAGYKPEEVEYLLEVFRDLSDPKAQKKAAQELANISAKVLEAEGAPTRPTGEEDPDERPLTKKEWERLEAERETERATQDAIKRIEAEAADKGYPPGSPGYNVLLSYMMEPDVAGDIEKAAAKVAAYEQEIVAKHTKQVQETAGKWPTGAPASAPNAPADPEAGPPKDWKGARQAALAFMRSKAGQTQ